MNCIFNILLILLIILLICNKNINELFTSSDNCPSPSLCSLMDNLNPSPSQSNSNSDSITPNPSNSNLDSITPNPSNSNSDSITPNPSNSNSDMGTNSLINSPDISSNELAKVSENVPSELQIEFSNIINSYLDYNGSIRFTKRMNNIMMILKYFNYREVSPMKILGLENKLKTFYHNYLKKLYKLSGKEVYNVDKNRINILIFPGSTYIIIEVLPKNLGIITLTKQEKELLEYYNFRRVFMENKQPVSEFEFKKMRQIIFDKINNKLMKT